MTTAETKSYYTETRIQLASIVRRMEFLSNEIAHAEPAQLKLHRVEQEEVLRLICAALDQTGINFNRARAKESSSTVTPFRRTKT